MPESPQALQFVPESPERDDALPMAPLVDIVFLLICFYLLVSQLVTRQKDAAVELPAMANPVVRQERPAELVINLRKDGTVTIGGRTVTLAAVRSLLAAQQNRAIEKDLPLRVVIRADHRGRFGELDEVFRVCREAGVAQITMRTRKEGAP